MDESLLHSRRNRVVCLSLSVTEATNFRIYRQFYKCNEEKKEIKFVATIVASAIERVKWHQMSFLPFFGENSLREGSIENID